MEKNWIFRKYNEGDRAGFLEWRKLVARRIKTPEFWNWEYFTGPWGPVESTLADDNGIICGQYSTQRFESFYLGEKLKGSLVFDVATHPNYRKRGMFVDIGVEHLSSEGKQGVPFSNGFPNEAALPGHKKVGGWTMLCKVPLLLNENVLELGIETVSNYEVKEIKEFGREFEGFSEYFKDDIPIYLNRTREYLNWRFVKKPGLEYQKYQVFDKTGEMVSYFILKYYHSDNGTTLHLIDFLIPKNEQLYQLILNYIITKAKNENINTISLFLMKYQPFREFLKKYNFEYKETDRIYIIHNNSGELDKTDLFEEKNHYITMADTDVY